MTWIYASPDTLRDRNGIDGDHFAELFSKLKAATRAIDRYCSIDGLRTFRVYTATQDFTPDSEILNLPDLLTVTSIKQDLDADQTFSTTWAASDYRLWPLNAPTKEEPYTQLRTLPHGNYTLGWPRGWTGGFPREYLEVFRGPIAGSPSMRITGKWGYWERLEDTGATLNGAVASTTVTTIPANNAANLRTGDTLLVDSEQLFVSALGSGQVTVERGTNGTTAATHLDATPIYRYVYPPEVVEVCLALGLAMVNAPDRQGVTRVRVGDLEESYGNVSATGWGVDLSPLDHLRRY